MLPDTLSVRDTALFFARAFSAAWDASIACWKVKYSTLHWRPVTAFQVRTHWFDCCAYAA